jgi:DNA-binding response OmpR family regulator
MPNRSVVFIIEDEKDLGDTYVEYLSAFGHDVHVAANARIFDDLVRERGAPDLLILDLNLPGEHGNSVLARIAATKTFPVLVISGLDDATERIVALEMGADDYLTKPSSLREIGARASGLLARYNGASRRLVLFETVTVDLTNQFILRNGKAIDRLKPGETALLRVLADHPGVVLSRQFLIDNAPGDEEDVFDRAIDNRISRLRRKLETERISTIRGHGYRFDPFVPTPSPASEEDTADAEA